MAPLLDVQDLRAYYYRSDGVVRAVDGVSFTVERGETLGLVGESGSGKSASVLALLGLMRRNGRVHGGRALFEGRDLLRLSREELRRLRGREIGMVFQDPMTGLNPTMRVGRQVMEPLLWHRVARQARARELAMALLAKVGIPHHRQRFHDYPFQFSGGMRQRVMIAMALACRPKLLIADEPTTALDVTVRAQVLNLIQDMKEESGMSVILITHDMGLAANFCDRLVVMYAGQVVESAPTAVFVRNPLHPYSQGLLRSHLDAGADVADLRPIPGQPPNLVHPPSGCRFHPRCEWRQPVCMQQVPALRTVAPGHQVACHLVTGGGAHG